MTTNILTAALALPDQELLARIDILAGKERQTSVELVAHLAALELRPSLYAAQGYGSLFAYCVQALRLSEDAACNRIDAARVCRQFPGVLDRLASGSISLSALRLLKPLLTTENHESVLDEAAHKTRKEVQVLIAALAPQPDVIASVRKLPGERVNGGGGDSDGASAASDPTLEFSAPTSCGSLPTTPVVSAMPSPMTKVMPSPAQPPLTGRKDRPVVEPSAPGRYRVQFTMGAEAHDDFRSVQALLRREIPNGDAGLIFQRAIRLLREKVEKEKMGAARRVQRAVIRPGTDNHDRRARKSMGADGQRPDPGRMPAERGRCRSRHIPGAVKRAVWYRDRGQCAFVSEGGRRCSERTFLQLHHIEPYALDGPATTGNISLRCPRHNQYEAEIVFGPRVAPPKVLQEPRCERDAPASPE